MAIQYEVFMNASLNSTYDVFTNISPSSTYDPRDQQAQGKESDESNIIFIVYLALIILLGVPGNIIVAIVYGRTVPKSACDYLILTMGITDACVCCLAPVILMRAELHAVMPWMSEALCCLEFWVQMTAMISSCVILVIIAMDRYVKICQPKLPSLTPVMAKYTCICCIIFCGAFCVYPAVVSVQTSHCLSDQFRVAQGVQIYLTVLFSFFVLSFIVVTYAYCNVIRQIGEKIKIKQRLIENTGLKPHEETQVKENNDEIEKTCSVFTSWRQMFTRWRNKTQTRVDTTTEPDAQLQMLPSVPERNTGENIAESKNGTKHNMNNENALLLAKISDPQPSVKHTPDSQDFQHSDHFVNGDCHRSVANFTTCSIPLCQNSTLGNKRIDCSGDISPAAAELPERLERDHDSLPPGDCQTHTNNTDVKQCNGSCYGCFPDTNKQWSDCKAAVDSTKSHEIETVHQSSISLCDHGESGQLSAGGEILPCAVWGLSRERTSKCNLNMMPAQIPSEHSEVSSRRKTNKTLGQNYTNRTLGCSKQEKVANNNIDDRCHNDPTDSKPSPSAQNIQHYKDHLARRFSGPVYLYLSHSLRRNKQFNRTSSLPIDLAKLSSVVPCNMNSGHPQEQQRVKELSDLKYDNWGMKTGPVNHVLGRDLDKPYHISNGTNEYVSEDMHHEQSVSSEATAESHKAIQSGNACTASHTDQDCHIDSIILDTSMRENCDQVHIQYSKAVPERHKSRLVNGDKSLFSEAPTQTPCDTEQIETEYHLNSYLHCNSQGPVLHTVISDKCSEQASSETNSVQASSVSTLQNRKSSSNVMELSLAEIVPKQEISSSLMKNSPTETAKPQSAVVANVQHSYDDRPPVFDLYNDSASDIEQVGVINEQSETINLISDNVDIEPKSNILNNTSLGTAVRNKLVALDLEHSASDVRGTHTLALPFPRPRSAIRSTSSASSRDSNKTPTFAEPPQRDNDSCIDDDDEVFSDVSTAVFFTKWRKFKERAGSKNSRNSKGSVKSTGSRKRFARERQMTFMLLSITVSFICSWLPPWMLYILIFWCIKDLDQNIIVTLYRYIGSMYLVNYVASPVIYYVFNVTYRAKVKALYSPLTRLMAYCRK